MTYSPFKPDWYYSEFTIDNLEEIQQEFFPLIDKFKGKEIVFSAQRVRQFESLVPKFVQWLKKFGFYDRWCTTAFGLVPAGKYYPPHIDSTDHVLRSQALNIPIANYIGTHTVWYQADIIGLPRKKFGDHFSHDSQGNLWSAIDPSFKTAAVCDVTTAKELCRLNTEKPFIMNITLPHGVENFTEKTRYLISTRFTPELDETDLQRLGISQPYQQNIRQ